MGEAAVALTHDDIMGKTVADLGPDELVHALTIPEWRIRNLYYIKDKEKRTVLFTPNEVQNDFIDRMWYRNLVPKARQRGFSTLVQILMLDTCLFVPETDAAVIAQDEATAKSIRDGKIKFAYDRLPAIVRRMVTLTTDNVTELQWDNGSRMTVSTSVRGGTISFLHVSEYGVICRDAPKKAEEIQEGSLPAVPETGIAVIESTVETPYGIFSDMVRESRANDEAGKKLNRLEYRLHFASWWDSDEYEVDPEGVIISPQDHAYFHRLEGEINREISLRKRAWYVTTRKSNFGGSSEKMKRQYPSTLDEAFEVAKDGLWLSEQMSLARTQRRIGVLHFDPSQPVNTFWDLGTNDATSIWFHQAIGPRDHFINFVEGSSEPPSYYVRRMQELREQHGYVWGKHFLPHDGSRRNVGTTTLKTYFDMLEELRLKDIERVPRTDNLDAAIDYMREDFANYWFDEVNCKEGLKHLDNFSKVRNDRLAIWTGGILKNGHDHAADALRQKSQAKSAGLLSIGRRKPSGRGRRASAMTA